MCSCDILNQSIYLRYSGPACWHTIRYLRSVTLHRSSTPPGLNFQATPFKSISASISRDYAKILRGVTLGSHSHLLTPPHRILGRRTLCSLSAYQLLQCSVQSIRQSCFTTTVTPSLPATCGRSPWARK